MGQFFSDPVEQAVHDGDELMRHPVAEGSAIGTLLSLRCGVMDRQLAQAMPLSFQEAFDTVLDKAEHGVPMDIAKGVGYLQKAGNDPRAKEELSHYKKTLFGKWVRR